jgi:hypothetical protein
MKKAFTKLASVLFLGCLAFWTIDAQAGCNDTSACNYVSTDVDALDCCFDNCVQISISSGTYDSEISWNLYDGAAALVASGGAPTVTDLCLVDDCYTFEGLDSFGDGWNGATYTITRNGASIATGTFAGSGGTVTIFVAADPLSLPCFAQGCMDPIACNYDSLVQIQVLVTLILRLRLMTLHVIIHVSVVSQLLLVTTVVLELQLTMDLVVSTTACLSTCLIHSVTDGMVLRTPLLI